MFYTILITVSNFRTTNSLALLWTQNVFRNMWPLNLYLKLIKACYDFCQKVHDRKSCSAQLSYLTDLAELPGHIPLFGTNCIQWSVCISGFHKRNLLSNQDLPPNVWNVLLRVMLWASNLSGYTSGLISSTALYSNWHIFWSFSNKIACSSL